MKEYSVYFSFYSEQFGDFEEAYFKVNAEDQFKAREQAWALIENNDNLKFASNIKLCGITWNASPLDLQDYFNAEASYEKYRLKCLESVDIPNTKLNNNVESLDYYERQKLEHYGSLQTISRIASDFGRTHGMLPPTVYEELHYARKFLSLLEGVEDFDKYNAFLKKIEEAEKWDPAALYDIREGCRHGYFSLEGRTLDFSAQLAKDGLYPTRSNLTDNDYTYINRWNNTREVKNLGRLPLFSEKDVVAASHTLQYDWQTLVLKMDALKPEYRNPLNAVWIANQESAANFDRDGDAPLVAENLITGETAEWKRSDFYGVLQPEKLAKTDYAAIKAEYKELIDEHGTGLEDYNEDDMEA